MISLSSFRRIRCSLTRNSGVWLFLEVEEEDTKEAGEVDEELV